MSHARVPRVTVLMPAYNAAKYIAESVRSVLGQSFTDFELLVIDDGSADDTPAVMRTLQDPRIRYIRHDVNAGLAPRLNEGLALARGEYIARLDADDVSRTDRLARQVKALDEDRDLAIVGSNSVAIDERGRILNGSFPFFNHDEVVWYSCFSPPFAHSTVMFRTRIVRDTLGGYDQTIIYGEDYELWSRLVRHGFRAARLPQRLIAMRQHRSSMSSRLGDHSYSLILTVVRQNLEFFFPDVSPSERDAFGERVAALTCGRKTITPEFVGEYLTFYRRFTSTRRLSWLQTRRVLSAHLIWCGKFAKGRMRWRALSYIAQGLLLEPRHLVLFEFPASIRRIMAYQAGQFWLERA